MSSQIHENIDRMIKEKNWTIYRLGKESGVSLTSLYKLKNNKNGPTTKTLNKLANVLGTTVDEIVRGEK